MVKKIEAQQYFNTLALNMSNIECSICCEPMSSGNVRALDCCHCFHRGCIDTWLVDHCGFACPTCREMPELVKDIFGNKAIILEAAEKLPLPLTELVMNVSGILDDGMSLEESVRVHREVAGYFRNRVFMANLPRLGQAILQHVKTTPPNTPYPNKALFKNIFSTMGHEPLTVEGLVAWLGGS